MNLYLYRPPSSTKPPKMLYGLTYGSVHRYFGKTHTKRLCLLLYEVKNDLQNRGHCSKNLFTLFGQALTKVATSSSPRVTQNNKKVKQPTNIDPTRVFMHIQYCPQNPLLPQIQNLFHTICKPAFKNKMEYMPVCILTIAYSNFPKHEQHVQSYLDQTNSEHHSNKNTYIRQ